MIVAKVPESRPGVKKINGESGDRRRAGSRLRGCEALNWRSRARPAPARRVRAATPSGRWHAATAGPGTRDRARRSRSPGRGRVRRQLTPQPLPTIPRQAAGRAAGLRPPVARSGRPARVSAPNRERPSPPPSRRSATHLSYPPPSPARRFPGGAIEAAITTVDATHSWRPRYRGNATTTRKRASGPLLVNSAAMSDHHFLVLTTCPDANTAAAIAAALGEQGVAACVNIVTGLRSVYVWQGARENADELLLLIKTTRAAYPALEQAITALHPYELPEIIAVPLAAGSAGYLDWISASVRP